MRFIKAVPLLAILLIPTVAAADDASALGPQTSAGSVSSTSDGGTLQPAGTNPLQSTTSDSTGLVPTGSTTLQAPVTNDDNTKLLLNNDADGTPHSNVPSATATGHVGRDLLVLALLAAVLAALYTLARRRIEGLS